MHFRSIHGPGMVHPDFNFRVRKSIFQISLFSYIRIGVIKYIMLWPDTSTQELGGIDLLSRASNGPQSWWAAMSIRKTLLKSTLYCSVFDELSSDRKPRIPAFDRRQSRQNRMIGKYKVDVWWILIVLFTSWPIIIIGHSDDPSNGNIYLGDV